MIKLVLPALAVLTIGLAPAAVGAQGKTLIIYGNDKCPENTICVRQSESERYRIPPSLRSGTPAPADQPWAARAASVASAGAATGTGSCTNVGPGGSTGCMNKMFREARAENKQAADAEAASPLPK